MSTETLPCITLHRPWALWVRQGWKTIETRTHERFKGLLGKRIAIHASKAWDRDAVDTARTWMLPEMILATYKWKANTDGRGKIVALATVGGLGWLSSQAGHARAAMIECKTPRFGLYLDNIQPIDGPTVKGQQGIFRVQISTLPPEAITIV